MASGAPVCRACPSAAYLCELGPEPDSSSADMTWENLPSGEPVLKSRMGRTFSLQSLAKQRSSPRDQLSMAFPRASHGLPRCFTGLSHAQPTRF